MACQTTPEISLTPYLDDLAARLQSAAEDQVLQDWQTYWSHPAGEGIFTARATPPRPAGLDWPRLNTNDTLGEEDIDRMVYSQLRGCSESIAKGHSGFLCVRCNYGVGILPALFGAPVYIMPREQDCLPNVRPLARDVVVSLADRGVPDLRTGYGERIFRVARRFQEVLRPYPELRKHIHIYHPDLQGPMDACELLWGSEIFTDLYDEPEEIHRVLDLLCATYEAFLAEWWRLVPPEEGLSYHWGMAHRGRIVLRDDSAMNLSPEMFDEFILPYDQRLLRNLGGGGIHSCGRVDHYIDRLAGMEGLTFFNMSQPSYNDMERVYAHTVDKGIRLLGLDRATAESARAVGRNLHGLVHC